MQRDGQGEKLPKALTPAGLSILMSLAQGEKHGYGIMLWVQDFDGKMNLGAGTLYRTLKRLKDDSLIERAEDIDSDSDDERRQYYRLTETGRRAMGAELHRLEQLVIRAQTAKLIPYPGMAISGQGA